MSYVNGPRVITNGLICYLDAANIKSYPGTGTTWYDLSPYGNNGTISSGEFVANGQQSYLRNSGNTSNYFYISITNTNSLSAAFSTITSGWTIEEVIWTNSVNYPEADAPGVGSTPAYGSGATGFDWNHGIGNTQFQFGQSSSSGGGYEDNVTLTVSSPYNSLNAWRVRTMVWNRGANTNYLYINSALIGTATTTNTANTAVYDGGELTLGTVYGWNHYGRRSVIRIYNYPFIATDVLQNYNAQKGRFSL